MAPNPEKVINEWCLITKVGSPELQPTNQCLCLSEVGLLSSMFSLFPVVKLWFSRNGKIRRSLL